MELHRYFKIDGQDLLAGRIPVREVAARHGTPLFVYDQDALAAKLRVLRAAFPPQFEIYYSIKANPNHAILEFFVQNGCGLELASGGELHRALEAGCEPARMLFAGPGKTAAELELAVRSGVGEIHVESFEEIERLAEIAARLDSRACVAVRVNPAAEVQGGAMRMGGKPAPFGFDEEILPEALAALLPKKRLDFSGVHLFAGTQILEASTLLAQYRRGVEIACQAARLSGKPIRTIDFGGGLGIPYFPNERELDVAALSAGLREVVDDVRRAPELAACRLVIEPGRYLVGEAGIYVAQVTSVKVSRGKKYLVLDGGMNHHLAASGNLGQVIKKNFPMLLANRASEPALEKVDVVGPLCTPLDTLARDASLPPARAGDLVAILQSGAYARSASPMAFLSHPSPPEVLVDGAEMRCVRRRGRSEGPEGP
jgi:diaminopimelate decarboxylase